MATKQGKSNRRKLVTVRERSEQAAPASRSRHIRRGATAAAKPLRAVGQAVAKLLRPLSFLLQPFKTRPLRATGRILAKVLLINYFRSAWKEVRQVTWPGRRETMQLTFAVFTFAIVFGLLITVTDYGLDKVFKKLILK